MTASFESTFKRLAPAVDFCSFRFVEESTEQLSVRQNIVEPPQACIDRGVMITVIDNGGYGYAATSDLTESGLREAAQRALQWAHLTASRSVTDYSAIMQSQEKIARGAYRSVVKQPPASVSLLDKIALLQQESAACKIDDRIVDWSASFWTTHTKQLFVTADGGMIDLF